MLAASLPAEADTDTAIGPAPKTEVRLLWDPEFLYVRFVSFDDEPFSPHGQQRDAPHYQGDVVEVFVDGVGDSRQWYELQVNPDGGVLDLNTVLSAPPVSDARGLLTVESNREYWSNLAYDMPGLRIATRREADAWIADLAIPAAELLRRRQANHLSAGTSLRLNLIRYDRPRAGGPDDSHRALHMACWSPVVLGRPHRSPQRMGVIHLVPSTP
ncbi:MAG: carbohydrate-binding family 9-like protein [Planctomycetota bacterium]